MATLKVNTTCVTRVALCGCIGDTADGFAFRQSSLSFSPDSSMNKGSVYLQWKEELKGVPRGLKVGVDTVNFRPENRSLHSISKPSITGPFLSRNLYLLHPVETWVAIRCTSVRETQGKSYSYRFQKPSVMLESKALVFDKLG